MRMEHWDYYISGIWKQKRFSGDYISYVFLHSTADGFGKGVKTRTEDVIGLLTKGASITTITWNYHLMQWRYGARVEYVETDDGIILRTNRAPLPSTTWKAPYKCSIYLTGKLSSVLDLRKY